MGNKLKLYVMILSIIISIILFILFIGILTNNQMIENLLLSISPNLNLPVINIFIFTGAVCIPAGTYVFLHWMDLKLFAQLLGTMVFIIIIGCVLYLLIDHPIIISITGLSIPCITFLIYWFILKKKR